MIFSIGDTVRFKEREYPFDSVCVAAQTPAKVVGYEFDSQKENVLCYWVQLQGGGLVRVTDEHVEKEATA